MKEQVESCQLRQNLLKRILFNKNMKAKDLRKKDKKELEKTVQELRKNLSELRFKSSSNKLKNSKEFNVSKKEIARILTILKENV